MVMRTQALDDANLRTNFMIMVYILGYFIHDFWASRAEWTEHKTDVFHHLLGMSIVGALLFVQPVVVGRYIPGYGIAELSTIFLNHMWFCRELGIGQSAFAALNSKPPSPVPSVTRSVHSHRPGGGSLSAA